MPPEGTPGTGDPAPAPATPPATPPVDWAAGLDADTVGHLQNRGWHGKPANEVAIAAVQAHRAAEKLIGAPAEQVVRLPTGTDPEAWKAVWTRLGAPADAAGYDFAGVKKADGSAPDQAFTDFMRTAAANYHLPKDTAAALATEFVKFQESAGTAAQAEATVALDAARAALKTNWGPNFEANMFVAKNTAIKLGVTPEQVETLEKVVGYDKVMEMFRSVGSKIGEDRFVTGGQQGSPGVMTMEQAVAKKSDLMRDTNWTQRYLAGGVAENREMMALNTIIVGDDTGVSRYA